MIDQDKLASIMDGVVAEYFDITKDGQLAPYWQHPPLETGVIRIYHLSPEDWALAVPLSNEELASNGIRELTGLLHDRMEELPPKPEGKPWFSRRAQTA